MTVYLEQGWVDATNEEDYYQCIGIDTHTFEIVDKEELIFEEDLPEINYKNKNWEEVLSSYKLKGWREQ